MGSVSVSWEGACRNDQTRSALLTGLERLAEISDAHVNLPRISQHYAEDGEGCGILRPTLRHPVRYCDTPLEGRVAIGPGLLDDGKKQSAILHLDDITLTGIVFHLFDMRELYPTDLPVVFATSESHPRLKGILCEPIPRSRFNEKAKQGDLADAAHLLVVPSIHLRYAYETWMDKLLSWMKFFYIPDLAWWRYEELSGWKTHSAAWSLKDASTMRCAVLDELAGDLEEEIRSCSF